MSVRYLDGLDPPIRYLPSIILTFISVLQAVQMGEFFLGVNLQHVREFDESLYRQMVTYPNECIPYIDRTLTQVVQDLLPDEEFDSDFEIRPFNADKTRNMRGLNPSGFSETFLSKKIIKTIIFVLQILIK